MTEMQRANAVFDVKEIVEIIMSLRVIYPPQNNLSSLEPQKQQKLLPSSNSPSFMASQPPSQSPSQPPSKPQSRTVSANSKHSKISSISAPEPMMEMNDAPFIVMSPDNGIHDDEDEQKAFKLAERESVDRESAMDQVVASMLAVEHNGRMHVAAHDPLDEMEQELLSTEREYTEGLRVLLEELISPIFENGLVHKKYRAKMSSSLPRMAGFHEDLLTELNTARNSAKSVCSAFLSFVVSGGEELQEIYLEFLADYGDILDLLGTTFHSHKLLDQFLKERKAEKKGLLSYLRFPMVRISGYILLCNDLSKYGHFEGMEAALSMLSEMNELMESEQKKLEKVLQCLRIQQSLHGLKYPIVDPADNRKFEAKLVFLEKARKHKKSQQSKHSMHQRQLYVFNDIIIIANLKNRVKLILDMRQIDIQRESEQSAEFLLITGITKPLPFCSQYLRLSDVAKLEHLIEVNRGDVWSQHDLALESVPSGGSSLRNQLARQLNSIL